MYNTYFRQPFLNLAHTQKDDWTRRHIWLLPLYNEPFPKIPRGSTDYNETKKYIVAFLFVTDNFARNRPTAATLSFRFNNRLIQWRSNRSQSTILTKKLLTDTCVQDLCAKKKIFIGDISLFWCVCSFTVTLRQTCVCSYTVTLRRDKCCRGIIGDTLTKN